MPHPLSTLALELRAIFAEILTRRPEDPRVRFMLRYDENYEIVAFSFGRPAKWPDVPYKKMNQALLALHHAGFISYGTHVIILNQKLLDTARGSTSRK